MSLESLALERLESQLPGLRRKKFREELLSIPPIGDWEGDAKAWKIFIRETSFPEIKFHPDACRYVQQPEYGNHDEWHGTVQIFEVEDWSKITERKLWDIQHWAFGFESEFGPWTDLFSVDRYGLSATLIWSCRLDVQGPQCGIVLGTDILANRLERKASLR